MQFQQIQQPIQQQPMTTEMVQKMLDENQQLILAIVENQKLGKYKDCASYQQRLQENLVKLASIADSGKKE